MHIKHTSASPNYNTRNQNHIHVFKERTKFDSTGNCSIREIVNTLNNIPDIIFKKYNILIANQVFTIMPKCSV